MCLHAGLTKLNVTIRTGFETAITNLRSTFGTFMNGVLGAGFAV